MQSASLLTIDCIALCSSAIDQKYVSGWLTLAKKLQALLEVLPRLTTWHRHCNRGPNTEPRGTLGMTSTHSEYLPLIPIIQFNSSHSIQVLFNKGIYRQLHIPQVRLIVLNEVLC